MVHNTKISFRAPIWTQPLVFGCFLVLVGVNPIAALAQIPDSTVVVSEFFEEIHTVDVAAQSVTDILDSPILEDPFGQHLAVLDSNTIAITDFADIHLYDATTQSTSLLSSLSFTPSEITQDVQGNLIATDPGGVFRIDIATGAATLVHTETFFNPSDAVVDSVGNIFVTEFFDGLGVVGSSGGFTPIGNFGTNEFANIDIGPDGQLYLASTFNGNFFRVDPSSGTSTLLASDAFTFLDDLQVTDAGDVLFGGTVDSVEGIFSLDPLTGTVSTIIDGDLFNDGFFNPLDIDIFSGQNRAIAVPEPAAASIVLLLLTGLIPYRRRKMI